MKTHTFSPKVSIIIPNYNHARYLPKRIESILNQTYTDFELIILDDCSSDNSQEVIQEYATRHPQIRVLFNEQNSGSTFLQWQKGLILARGEYVWIAESDDFAEPAFLAVLVPLLDEYPSLSMAYSNSTIVDEHDQPMGTTADWKNQHFCTNHWGEDFMATGQDELNAYLSKTCTVNNASSVVFRKKAMLDSGGVNTDYRYTGDWLMYQKMCLQGGIAYRAACLSNYREHRYNTSTKSVVDSKDLLERQKCFAFVFDKGLSPLAKQEMLIIASKELSAIFYTLLRQTWKPALLLRYIRQISAVNMRYYAQVQLATAQLLFRKH